MGTERWFSAAGGSPATCGSRIMPNASAAYLGTLGSSSRSRSLKTVTAAALWAVPDVPLQMRPTARAAWRRTSGAGSPPRLWARGLKACASPVRPRAWAVMRRTKGSRSRSIPTRAAAPFGSPSRPDAVAAAARVSGSASPNAATSGSRARAQKAAPASSGRAAIVPDRVGRGHACQASLAPQLGHQQVYHLSGAQFA